MELKSDVVFRRFIAGNGENPGETPAFLVATSAGEVGVDLDADHMVGDLVAWERMVQRLGRVNRTGRPEPATVDVVWSRTAGKAAKEDPEDEPEDDRMAAWRAPFEALAWRAAEDGRRPAGPGALRRLNEDPAFRELAGKATTPEPLRPELTDPLLQAWAMTSLAEHSSVAPALGHGCGAGRRIGRKPVWRGPECFRCGNGEGPDRGLLEFFYVALSAAPVLEVLEAETSLVVSVLKARAAGILKHAPFGLSGRSAAGCRCRHRAFGRQRCGV